VAAPVYATEAEYEASPYGLADAPDDLVDRLAIASRHIDAVLKTAVYDVDGAGVAVDEDERAAIRDATIAQASWEINPMAGRSVQAGQLPGGFTSVSAGPISMSRATPTAEIEIGGISYSAEVATILDVAGLLPGFVWTY
jgi:hypothetical protein